MRSTPDRHILLRLEATTGLSELFKDDLHQMLHVGLEGELINISITDLQTYNSVLNIDFPVPEETPQVSFSRRILCVSFDQAELSTVISLPRLSSH